MTSTATEKVTKDDVDFSNLAFEADFHFGLIPLDPERSAEEIEPSIHRTTVGDQDVHVFTDGDSWVEWGERRDAYADQAPRHDNGRMYGAPGLHVIVRFGQQPVLEPTFYPPERRTSYNPTGLQKSVEYLASERAQAFFALGIEAIERVFNNLLTGGYRLCDYGVLTSALDWSEAAAWDVNNHRVMGMYA